MDTDREKVKTAYQQMTIKEKIGYILQNYWLQILIGIALLGMLVWFIGRFTFDKPQEKCLQIGIRAKVLDPDAIDALPLHLEESHPGMTENGEKQFWAEQFYTGYSQAEAEEANAMLYRLAGSVAAGMLDVVVGDQESMVNDVSMGLYLDLREVFTEEEFLELERLASERAPEGEEGILYVSYKITTYHGRAESVVKDLPCLIRVAGGDAELDACAPGLPLYLGIVNNTSNLEQVKTWIWSLLSEKAD